MWISFDVIVGDEGLGREHRLRRKADIDGGFKRGVKRDGRMFSFRCLTKEDPTPRLLVVVNRKVGSPVQRNRVKRGVREAFRTHKQLFTHRDVVVVARPGAGRLTPGEIARRVLEEYQEVHRGAGNAAN